MTRYLRLICLLLAALAVPAAAHAQWDTPNRAFHKATGFPLDGRHLAVPCASCHLNGVTRGTPKTCESCHWERRQDDLYRLRLGSNCAQCHRSTSWTATKWDHGAVTGMALNSAHKTVSCGECHKSGQFTAARISCFECHRDDYEATRTPNHRAAGFSTACESCHKPSDTTFTQSRLNHAAVFPLVGLHATAACATCHVGAKYKGTPRDCYGCHKPDYDQTRTPNHAASGFGTTCESCHKNTDSSWTQGNFVHTWFPIASGRHSGISCATCHTSPASYTVFSCFTGCHNRTTTDNQHRGRTGYQYVATACYACHPTGRAGVPMPSALLARLNRS
jgi:hypothetical protein